MKKGNTKEKKTSIFRAIFVPLILIMILQSLLFYFSAVYGGIEESLNQNSADILSERLVNRSNELETHANNEWNDLSSCEEALDLLYEQYQSEYGANPFAKDKQFQVDFLSEATDQLVKTLRNGRTNGIFLILNDQPEKTVFDSSGEEKYGVCIRDMDSTSAYVGNDDLLLERSPSAIVDQLGCSLDSWWEAHYRFEKEEEGSYYYEPLKAAWDNPEADGEDIAYFCGAHHISKSDNEIVSYSIPLMDEEGKPYAVLGIELTTKYLSSLLPGTELGDSDKSCYMLALRNVETDDITPIVASSSLYSRCFVAGKEFSAAQKEDYGGFLVIGREGSKLYGAISDITIYNNNNPFEENQLCLVGLVQKDTLFAYSSHVKKTLFIVSLLSLALGIICIFIVSQHFAAPITRFAKKARGMDVQEKSSLDHLGIVEIDQLVDSIEKLNQNVSKEIARTEFFSRMSHDMRTPMNAIISFSSQEMLEGVDEATKDEYLKKVHSSGSFLLGLINEVLDMTKIESNKVDLHYDDVCGADLFGAVIPMIEKLAQGKNVIFEKDLRIPEHLYVKADQQHLDQIALNLLSNAVKFTPENGKVTLFCQMEESRESRDQVSCVIRVKDTGIGMSEEFMEKLYTPFEQENAGGGGTGLGLSICRKLIVLMNGTITCQSRKQEGTSFEVNLNFQRAKQGVKKSIADKPEIAEKIKLSEDVLKGKRILLCEDQPLNTQIAKRLLEKKGMLVDAVPNGQEGVDYFEKSNIDYYDVILMDIRMPVLDGLGATRAIRALEREDAKKIPIIAMTANAFEEDMRMSREAGMNEHLSKPIEPDKLYRTLVHYLSREE